MTRESVLFVFEDVVVSRAEVVALDGFSGMVPSRGVTAVFGPSGSGKSTLLRLCNRLEVPSSGRVLFREDDVAALDPLLLRRQVGMCFQRPTPFPGTIADNLRVAAPHADRSQMQDVLARAALNGSWLDRDAGALSGGEAQRMCLARTLITEPLVLLLDEPTSALDAAATTAVESVVRDLADAGMPALWVTHDAAQVGRIADRVLRIEAGRFAGMDAVRT